MRTLKGPAIFLAQFAGDKAPFDTLDNICEWAAGLGYKGIQIPTWVSSFIDLEKAAKEEGSLVVYGCCEEPYISAACDKYTEIFGIQTSWQRLSTGEVLAKIEEENGSPSAVMNTVIGQPPPPVMAWVASM